MHLRRMFNTWCLFMSATWSLSAPAVAAGCADQDRVANTTGAIIPGHASAYTVTGTGRLQFYSAPSKACRMHGVFIVPGDTVTAYRIHEGFVSVLYLNLKTGTDASGWVELKRLSANGTGVAPAQ